VKDYYKQITSSILQTEC